MTRLRSILLLGIAWMLGSAVGCGGDDSSGDGGGGGGDKSCSTLCSEAQLGSCTTITGDCGAFCSALDSASPKASCDGARNAYESCLSSGATACDKSCGSSEKALEDCLAKYCLGHSGDADCKTLVASF